MQASKARVLAQVKFVRAVVEHIGSSTLIFPLDPSDFDPELTDPVPDPTVVAPPTDEANDLP